MNNWPIKDPDDVLDYSIDWTARLAGDTISSSIWIVPAGITKDSDSNTDSISTIWLSAGTVGQRYNITNRITTVAGRTIDNTVSLIVQEQ